MAGGKLGGYDCRTLFWNNKACYCNNMNSVFGNGGKTALLISNDKQCKSHTF